MSRSKYNKAIIIRLFLLLLPRTDFFVFYEFLDKFKVKEDYSDCQ